jgi:hypothetical protein
MSITVCIKPTNFREHPDEFILSKYNRNSSAFQDSAFVVCFTYWSKLKALESL